jgi:3-ketosteroid 9alpha-monooxygenase subunit A
MLVTEAVYHGPSVLITRMSGLYDSYIFIAHTPVDDGSAYVWHALLVRTPDGSPATEKDNLAARAYQDVALAAFAQDFEVWKHKQPCLQGLFVQGDGAFLKQRTWYKQFYNPRAKKHEYLRQSEGIHVPRGMEQAPDEMREASHEALLITVDA